MNLTGGGHWSPWWRKQKPPERLFDKELEIPYLFCVFQKTFLNESKDMDQLSTGIQWKCGYQGFLVGWLVGQLAGFKKLERKGFT